MDCGTSSPSRGRPTAAERRRNGSAEWHPSRRADQGRAMLRMTQPVIVEGLVALDVIVAAQKLAETWPRGRSARRPALQPRDP